MLWKEANGPEYTCFLPIHKEPGELSSREMELASQKVAIRYWVGAWVSEFMGPECSSLSLEAGTEKGEGIEI